MKDFCSRFDLDIRETAFSVSGLPIDLTEPGWVVEEHDLIRVARANPRAIVKDCDGGPVLVNSDPEKLVRATDAYRAVASKYSQALLHPPGIQKVEAIQSLYSWPGPFHVYQDRPPRPRA